MFHLGVCSAAHSNRSTMILSAGSAGKIQACCAMYSFRMSFWMVPCSWSIGTPWLLGRGDVEAEEHGGRTVDRHRGGDLVQRDAVEQRLHVGQARDGDAALPHLALGAGMVGVVAHQGGKVECDREAGLAPLQQELVALVGVLGRAEAGELPHGPEPAAIHRGVDAAGIGKVAGQSGGGDARRVEIERRCRPARPSRPETELRSASSRTGSAAACGSPGGHLGPQPLQLALLLGRRRAWSASSAAVLSACRHMRSPCFSSSSTSAASS